MVKSMPSASTPWSMATSLCSRIWRLGWVSLQQVIDHFANCNYVAIKNLPTPFSQLQAAWISLPELYLEKDSKRVVHVFHCCSSWWQVFCLNIFWTPCHLFLEAWVAQRIKTFLRLFIIQTNWNLLTCCYNFFFRSTWSSAHSLCKCNGVVITG